VLPISQGSGTLEGGAHGPMPYIERAREWGEPPAAPKADRLVVETTNIARATIDPKRARLSCDAELEVTTDGPLSIRLAGCERRERFG
jgi:hypothetical protein